MIAGMLRVGLLFVLPMFVLGAWDWTSAQPCNEFNCVDTCILDDSCEPVIVNFHKDCDDLYWGQIGLPNPDPEEICTQCCDEQCNSIQTFPNCTGESCNQCYDGPGEAESTESYDLQCCEIDGVRQCGLCTVPEGWNADLEAELESKLPDGAVLSIGDDDLCGPDRINRQCSTCEVAVTSSGDSCEFTRDLKCRGWYENEKTPDCRRWLPSTNKAQFISASFERLTVLCEAGETAKCEKVPGKILGIDVTCPRPCYVDVKGAGIRLRNLRKSTETEVQTVFTGFGDIDQPENRAQGANVPITSTMSLTLSYDESGKSVEGFVENSVGCTSMQMHRLPRTSNNSMIDPVTGDVKEHEICELFIRAEAASGENTKISVEDLNLNVEGVDYNLGTFSHNSADGGSTLVQFCRDDYGGGFAVTANVKLEGVFSNSEENSKVEIQCGTRPLA
ncbi:hypothetical protein NDN08_002141 [Rhodosorus marinus]|uniref:Uncharacterized protein n=1 Tax=Rhodosorus marinus TaxID=101924 RepID=A0AAV8USU9_9RHOD|nr:hypothetical protein NDN08_002141 [Rhodosorus marinus]